MVIFYLPSSFLMLPSFLPFEQCFALTATITCKRPRRKSRQRSPLSLFLGVSRNHLLSALKRCCILSSSRLYEKITLLNEEIAPLEEQVLPKRNNSFIIRFHRLIF